jgi:hypothetical protein
LAGGKYLSINKMPQTLEFSGSSLKVALVSKKTPQFISDLDPRLFWLRKSFTLFPADVVLNRSPLELKKINLTKFKASPDIKQKLAQQRKVIAFKNTLGHKISGSITLQFPQEGNSKKKVYHFENIRPGENVVQLIEFNLSSGEMEKGYLQFDLQIKGGNEGQIFLSIYRDILFKDGLGLEIRLTPAKDLTGISAENRKKFHYVRIRGLDRAPKGASYTLEVVYPGQPSLFVNRQNLGKTFSGGEILPVGQKPGFRIPRSKSLRGKKVVFILRETGGENRMIRKAFKIF